MKKEDLDGFNKKSLSNVASETEKKILENWYGSMEGEEDYLHKLSAIERARLENKIFSRIQEALEARKSETKELKIHRSNQEKYLKKSIILKVAAAFIVGVCLVYLSVQLLPHDQDSTSYTTDYGETLHIILPDSSTATLNGNSTITYRNSWNENEPREISLKGEAYFSVRQSKQKLLVHTSPRFTVEVLGTEFLVSNRKTRTHVVLNSGKIHLNYTDKNVDKTVKMDPGDLIVFQNNDPAQYILKRVNPEIYSSWKDNSLMLDNTSLREICFFLQENYGLGVEFSNERLLNQRVSGSIPLNHIDTLLKDISAAYGININKLNKIIKLEEF